VQVVGRVSDKPATLFLPNHSSWLDILVLGSVLRASFVAKSEVGEWPVIGIIAKLGRTVFVKPPPHRNRAARSRYHARKAASGR